MKRHVAVVLALLLGGMVPPAIAAPDIEEQVRRMNRRAMLDYDGLEFEMARQTLVDALNTCRRTGIDDTRVAARTHVNLGIVYAAGFKDRTRGLQQFVEAIKIDRAIRLDPAIATPEIEELWAKAREKATLETAPASPPPVPSPPTPPPAPPIAKPAPVEHAYHRLFCFVMPGFGFGFHPAGNQTEVAYRPLDGPNTVYGRVAVVAPGGVAIAPFHLAIEIGGMVTRHFSISLLGRFELVTGANAQTQSPAENGGSVVSASASHPTAIAGFLRARYRFLDGKLHPYIHVDLGGGEIRHALDLTAPNSQPGTDGNLHPFVDQATATAFGNYSTGPMPARQFVCPSGKSCYDSLRMGYLFVGGGAGLSYDVWKYLAIVIDLNVLGGIGVGGGQSGLDVDLQLGLGAHFL